MQYSEERTQRVSAYAHKLNQGMIDAMMKVHKEYIETGEPVNVIKLKSLTYNQASNFQKLKFWGLVVAPEKGRGYVVTKRGVDFLRGKISIMDSVASIDNEAMPYDHECWDTHSRKPVARVVYEFFEMSEYTYYKNFPEFQKERGSDIPRLF